MSEPLDPDLKATEAALAALAPAPAAVNRDALMFRAGRAAAARGRRLWPLATAVSSAAAAVLSVLLVTRPAPPAVEKIVYQPAPPPAVAEPAPPAPAPGGDDSADPWPKTPYARLQDRVLRFGLDGLGEPPPPPPPAEGPPPPGGLDDLLNSL
jgi:hypothetical protein